MTVLQAAAILTLWRCRRFDTLDIATVIGVAEADVCQVLNAVRERERGADLWMVGAGEKGGHS